MSKPRPNRKKKRKKAPRARASQSGPTNSLESEEGPLRAKIREMCLAGRSEGEVREMVIEMTKTIFARQKSFIPRNQWKKAAQRIQDQTWKIEAEEFARVTIGVRYPKLDEETRAECQGIVVRAIEGGQKASTTNGMAKVEAHVQAKWMAKTKPHERLVIERITAGTRDAIANGYKPAELVQMAKDKTDLYDMSDFERLLNTGPFGYKPPNASKAVTYNPTGIVEWELETIERERPLHERLMEALGKDLKSTGSFRKAIELELRGDRSTKAVHASIEAFIKKLVDAKPGLTSQDRAKTYAGFLSHLGSAFKAYEELPLKQKVVWLMGNNPAAETEQERDRLVQRLVDNEGVSEDEARQALHDALTLDTEAIDSSFRIQELAGILRNDTKEALKLRSSVGTGFWLKVGQLAPTEMATLRGKVEKFLSDEDFAVFDDTLQKVYMVANHKLSPELVDKYGPRLAKLDPQVQEVATRLIGARVQEWTDDDHSIDMAEIIYNANVEVIRSELSAADPVGGFGEVACEAVAVVAEELRSPEERGRLYDLIGQRVQKSKPGQENLRFEAEKIAFDGPINPMDMVINLDDLVRQVRDEFDHDAATDRTYTNAKRGGSTFMLTGQQRPQGKKREKPEQQTVESYMEALHNAFLLTRMYDHKPREKRDAIFLYNCLREARIFHIENEMMNSLVDEVGRYVIEDLAGLEYEDYSNYRTLPEAQKRSMDIKIGRLAQDAPYPEKFPFEVVFLGYGHGMEVPGFALRDKAPSAIKDDIQYGKIIGHLMIDTGEVYGVIKAFVQNAATPEGTWTLWFNPERLDGTWPRVADTEPWLLPMVINIINEHRTFVLEQNMPSDMRKDYKRNRKGMGLKDKDKKRWGYTPPPYYTLKLKSKVIKERARKHMPKPRAPKGYKTDVRGHERCRIKRGPLPMDPEVAIKLRKLDYTIFTIAQLDAETLRRLHERSIPFKKSDEWMAIKVSWIDSFMSSLDPNLPYVPACRTLGSINIKPKPVTNSWGDDPRNE